MINWFHSTYMSSSNLIFLANSISFSRFSWLQNLSIKQVNGIIKDHVSKNINSFFQLFLLHNFSIYIYIYTHSFFYHFRLLLLTSFQREIMLLLLRATPIIPIIRRHRISKLTAFVYSFLLH